MATFLDQIGEFFQPIGDWISDKAKDVGDWITDVTTSDSWDSFLNGSANKINQEIAETNLDYQKQRNEIEDARYAEETAYNRAFAEENQAYNRAFSEEERNYNRMFAEEERDYQRAFAKEQQEYDRALQKEIFNREDTAIQRQAAALSELGINPISQNLNGLGAGQALQSVAPSMASAPSSSSPSSFSPSASSRKAEALENKFLRKSQGVVSAIAPMLSIASMFQDYQTGNLQRDSLALMNDKQYLSNLIFAKDHGVDWYNSPTRFNNDRYGDFTFPSSGFEFPQGYEADKRRDSMREWKGKEDSGIFDFDSPTVKNIKSIGNMDFNKVLENALTNAAKLGKGVLDILF